MPGIFGLVLKKTTDTSTVKKNLDLMKNILSHQPWYFSQVYTNQNVGLGVVSVRKRFSVNTIVVDNGKYVVLIDGYIYKIQGKLTRDYSDLYEETAEKVLKVFLEQGENGLTQIEGNFYTAIYHLDEEILYLFNDIIGPKRVYFADLPEMFVFAPELKGISFLEGFKKEIDWKAVSDFLHNSYVLGDDTFFTSVKSLSSASIIKYEKKNNKLSVKKYWNPRYSSQNTEMGDAIDDVYNLVYNSIDEKLSENDSVISPISGGLDSRLILAILHDLGKKIRIKPVTYAQKFSREYKLGRKVVNRLKLSDYLLLDVEAESVVDNFLPAVWLSDGMSQLTNAHLLLFPENINRNFDYLFNGIYGGPTNYSALYFTDRHLTGKFSFEEKVNDIRKVMSLRSDLFDGIFPENIQKIIKESVYPSIADELQKKLDVSNEFANQRDAFFIENRMRRGICQGGLYKFFWEEQLPLSNFSLYYYYLSMAPELKLKRLLLKGMLIEKFPDLARIRDANTGLNLYQNPTRLYRLKNKISHDFKYYLSRASQGRLKSYNKTTYAHYDIWLQKNRENTRLYQKYLFDSAINSTGLFNLQGLKRLFEDTLKGGPGFYHIVGLTTFAIWYHYFVAENDIAEIKQRLQTLPQN